MQLRTVKLRWALITVMLSGAALVVAQTTQGSADREAFLFRALDSWSLDLSLSVLMLQDPYPLVRTQAVQVMASNPEASRLHLLGRYLLDRDAGVRGQVMLAAGRLGSSGLDLATRGLNDPSPAVRQAAVWAASHAGEAAWGRLSMLVTTEKNPAVLEMLLANLWRLEGAPWQATAARFSVDASPYLRRAAAFSLSRNGDPSARKAQRLLIADEEPVIRATALRGFERGSLADSDLAVVASALSDPDWRVRAAAWRALAAQKDAKLPADAKTAFSAAIGSDHPHLAAAALSAAASHRSLGTQGDLLTMVNGNDRWLAAEALVVQVGRDDEAAKKIASSWSASSEIWQRRAAARTATGRGAEAEAKAAADTDPGVRLAWLGSLEEEEVSERRERLLAVLGSDSDPAVRSQALALLQNSKIAPGLEDLLDYVVSWKNDALPDARAEALIAAYEASTTTSEKGSILELGLNDTDSAVAAMVVNGVRGQGDEVVLPPREGRHNGRWYRELVQWKAEPRWLDVSTNRGAFRIRLDLENAPLTAREIWDLAADGFYDGLGFHRVVPNFVVQGGDPRGDGWGGPGFALPDEPSLQPFDSWSVGVATSGPQTGGCQLFVTLTPADHLTGHYTNIGEVVAGRDVLTRIRVGDTMLDVQALTGAEPPPLAE